MKQVQHDSNELKLGYGQGLKRNDQFVVQVFPIHQMLRKDDKIEFNFFKLNLDLSFDNVFIVK